MTRIIQFMIVEGKERYQLRILKGKMKKAIQVTNSKDVHNVVTKIKSLNDVGDKATFQFNCVNIADLQAKLEQIVYELRIQ